MDSFPRRHYQSFGCCSRAASSSVSALLSTESTALDLRGDLEVEEENRDLEQTSSHLYQIKEGSENRLFQWKPDSLIGLGGGLFKSLERHEVAPFSTVPRLW